jgi:hypothetical protein
LILNDFSYDTYRSLLNLLLRSSSNLCFSDFAKKKPAGSFLLLRHDVDYTPEAALKMAELEANMGIKATYFILFSSPHYNLFNKEYILFPRKLAKMGHEVGLHYDLEAFEAFTNKNPTEILKFEIDTLSTLAGIEVKSIAMHNPSLSGADLFRDTEFVNAYDDKFTKKVSYFSDSCGAWRDEFVNHIENQNIPPQMQLLIHPIFWGPTPLNRWETLDLFIKNKKNNLSNECKLTQEIWRNHSGAIAHDKRNNV